MTNHETPKSGCRWYQRMTQIGNMQTNADQTVYVQARSSRWRQVIRRQLISSASIVPLFLRCRPAAIVRLVMAVVVFSVDRVLGRWSRSHVGVEVGERVPPTITDANTAAPVSIEPIDARLIAAVPHAVPNSVFGGAAHSMCDPSHAILRGSVAAAAPTVAAHQVTGRDQDNGTTVAAAFPAGSLMERCQSPDGNQFTEPLTVQRFRLARHCALGLIVLALCGVSASAQNGTVAPLGVQQFFDNSGNPLASGKVYFYNCGGLVNRTVYSNAGLSVAHTQPIALNSAGRPPSNTGIFLTPGVCHKMVVATSADVELYSIDNIGPGHGVGNDRLRLSTHSATIATGAITVLYSHYTVDTESAAASDDLDTLTPSTGVGAGFVVVLVPANVARVVTVTSSGNVRLVGGNARLNATGSSLTLMYDGSVWVELARSRAGGWTVVTTTATGTQSDFDPGIVGDTVIRANNASALTITGFAAGVAGQQIIVQCVNSTVETDHTPSASAAANELINIATSANTPCSTGGRFHYVYDATTTMWRLVDHDQGAWLTATFAESHFLGDAVDGNWTLDSADRSTLAYRLMGRALTVSFYIVTTDSANTPASLQILNGQWGSFTAAKLMLSTGAALNATAVATSREGAVIFVDAGGGTVINIAQTDAGTWTATTSDNTTVYGTITFEVN